MKPDEILSLLNRIYTGLSSKLSSWEFLIYGLILSLLIIFAGYISPIRDKLEPMYTNINPYVVTMLFVILSGLTLKGLKGVQKAIEIKARRRQQEEYIQTLTEEEQEIFDMVKKGSSCGVWIPLENAASLTLLYKGLIKNISKISSWQTWSEDHESEYCMLVILSDWIKK